MSYDFMGEIRKRLDYMEGYLEKRNFLTDELTKEKYSNGTDTEKYKELWEEFVAFEEMHKKSR